VILGASATIRDGFPFNDTLRPRESVKEASGDDEDHPGITDIKNMKTIYLKRIFLNLSSTFQTECLFRLQLQELIDLKRDQDQYGNCNSGPGGDLQKRYSLSYLLQPESYEILERTSAVFISFIIPYLEYPVPSCIR